MNRVTAIFYTASTIAGFLGGLIAYGVEKNLRDAGRLLSWQWLFIIEGLLSLAVGIFLFFFLLPFPEHLEEKESIIFNREEIEIAVQRTMQG